MASKPLLDGEEVDTPVEQRGHEAATKIVDREPVHPVLLLAAAQDVGDRLAAADGSSVADATPSLEVAYASPTGVGMDTSTLAFAHDSAPLSVSCAASAESASCTPTAPFSDGVVSLEVTVSDLEGNASFADVVTVTVDTVAPVLTIESPADGTVTWSSQITCST
ncbi:MAG: hypothetical protein MI919_19915 [Holophagales bacterium]|nr:hypothetical protein [Holophagales bacterium]